MRPRSLTPIDVDMLSDELPIRVEPGEQVDAPRHSRPGRGRPGRNAPPRQREYDSDALSAFTHFFRAKAQAKELAIRKEAHAFDQQIRAERSCPFTGHRPHGRNMTVDYCRPRREPTRRPPRSKTLPSSRAPPATAAQVIADIVNNTDTILTPAPTPAAPVIDPSPDMEEIIAAAEQLDLKQVGQMQGVTTENVFSRFIPVVLLINTSLILFIVIAAFASLGPSKNT
ncbi:uncharacterized protein F5147DRAFT_768897 [Suillus discolor]|uniref:Uncharacterized protein n=1 Tax=Suillus discolor TaxID=1912936 RepID=A0A9P7FGN6_9AGAM|nr:uncharacterized protein F5147DRAFT_768897 [Suillus discolor]KAG2116519.1 hypothetical protein F5147DRAFT_768897 [Suillus discolor]